MNYREVELLNRKAYDADGTETITIDFKDPISQIMILYEGLNQNRYASTAHPCACITDITLKDGSDIIYSLDGYEAQAMDFYHRGHEPANIMYYGNDWYFEMQYNLNFGRKLWDKKLALDPSHFSNLQLTISVDLDAGGSEPDAGYLTARASVFDEKKIEPVGFLTHKEHRSYTGGGATHVRTKLPVDNAYRMLMFRAYRATKPPENLFDVIKLEEDAGTKIPFELFNQEWEHFIQQQWPPYTEWIMIPCRTTEDTHHCTPSYWTGVTISEWHDQTPVTYQRVYGGDGGTFTAMQATGAWNAGVMARGWCPHTTLCYPFGDQQDYMDWYEMEKVEDLIVDILGKAPGDGYKYYICSQQFRRY